MATSITSGYIGNNYTNFSVGAYGNYSVIARFKQFYIDSTNVYINTYLAAYGNGSITNQTLQVNIWLNGVQVVTNNAGNGDVTYSFGGYLPLQTIRVTLYNSTQFSYLGFSGNGSVSYDSGTLTINQSTNSDFTFFKSNTNVTTSNPQFVILPRASACNGLLRYFKNAGTIAGGLNNNNAYSYVLTSGGDTISDLNSYGIKLQDDYACLTLYSDGISWYIANYYPTSYNYNGSTNVGELILPTTNSALPSGNKVGNASMNAINIFSTNPYSERQSGDNMVNLPSISANSGMCIVVYSGNTSANRTFGNALTFSHTNNIDRNANYTSSNRPYIVSDLTGGSPTLKSTGIVFITDGNNWYITGWFNSAYWYMDIPSSGGGSWGLGSSDSNEIDNVISKESGGGGLNRYYSLPTYVISNPGYFRIIKLVGNQYSGLSGVTFSTYYTGASITNFINDSVTRICYSNNQTNSCLWLVGINDSSIIRWYPIIGYTTS